MEEDRAATNLGPEEPLDIPSEQPGGASKQPRKRFIGSRAAAERAAARSAIQDETTENSGALQAPQPARRAPRTLNQVPPEILYDPDINEAIAHLPANYNFEIHKTIHRIRSSGSTNIALQFPEGLLLFAPLISDILTRFCPGSDTVIMGDVTYGACCIDDFTARAIGCDLLVHYGHSCLVPVDTTKGIKTLYVFVTIGIDVEHLIATIEKNFQPGKKIALVGTIQFNSTLHTIVPRLKTMGYEASLPRSAPLSAGEILGCTAPTLTATSSSGSGSSASPPSSGKTPKAATATADADMILYVGDGRFHLESILIASPALRAHTYRYDPYTRRLTHETYEHEEMHSLRRHAIQTARKSLAATRTRKQPSTSTTAATQVDVSSVTPSTVSQTPEPTTWAIILGTLGRQGNPHTVSLITARLTHLGIPHITLLLSEVQPAKLARMSADVAVWVQVACPRLSIDWGYAFERPLLSPYEACVALGIKESGGWDGVGIDDTTSENVSTDARSGVHSGESEAGGDGETPIYPMDFYGKEGLGRTKAEDVTELLQGLEIEVR